jgi:hypothetical protein
VSGARGPHGTCVRGRSGARRAATLSLRADVAELVDAHGSGPCGLRLVEVQVLSSASPGPTGRDLGLGADYGKSRRGAPPQSRQREILRVAVLAEPGALVCERLPDTAVEVAERRQQRCADRPASNALLILAHPGDMRSRRRTNHVLFVGRRLAAPHTRTASSRQPEVHTSTYLRRPPPGRNY